MSSLGPKAALAFSAHMSAFDRCGLLNRQLIPSHGGAYFGLAEDDAESSGYAACGRLPLGCNARHGLPCLL
jgi:hypothetical protein